MIADGLQIEQGQVHKLLCAGNGDAALLYLYIHSGNDGDKAISDLKLTKIRYDCAAATLRQLGLWPEKKTVVLSGERPRYSETDVAVAEATDTDFNLVRGEVERILGKNLVPEELKILLGFTRYLGLSPEVISVLCTYCKNRAQQHNRRRPTMISIEKEAYAWAEQGIDTMEEAAAYIQNQNMRRSRLGQLMNTLQIYGRKLTASEEKYALSWLDMGFDEEVLALAYDRTCLNTGGLSWAYMNKILLRWKEAGYKTAAQIRGADQKPNPKGATGALGQEELAAIQRALREG